MDFGKIALRIQGLIKPVVFLLLLLVFAAHAAPSFAQTQSSNQSIKSFTNTDPDVPQNLHTYTQSVFIEIAAAISCQITGIDPTNPSAKCLGIDPNTHKIGYVENGGGLITLTGSMIAQTFDIPVSTSDYVRYMAGNFGIAKNTYADNSTSSSPTEFNTDSGSDNGVGFTGLKKMLPLWVVFRNLIYMIFVFIFVVIGIGIMFRVKIDPRTVMTIQNQIPKIIIALILVTFSYAIAGFLIDLMYVFMYIVYNTFAAAHLIDVAGLSPAKMQGQTPLQAINFFGGIGIAWKASTGIGSILASLFDGTTGKLIVGIVSGIILAIVGGGATLNPIALVGGLALGFAGGLLAGNQIVGVIGEIIAFVVISAAILTALFRLWFQLIKTYISILINVVLAPFWIAGGLIPTSPLSFTGWLRDMLANLMSYPVVLFMLLIGRVFVETFGNGNSANNFTPPFIGNPGNTKSFGALIGLGIILLTPNVVNLIRQAVKAPSGKIAAGIGQSISIGAGVVSSPISSFGKKMWGVDQYTREAKPLYHWALKGLHGITTKEGALGKLGKPLGPVYNVLKHGVSSESLADFDKDEAKRLKAKEDARKGGGSEGASGSTTPQTSPNGPTTGPTPNTGGEIDTDGDEDSSSDSPSDPNNPDEPSSGENRNIPHGGNDEESKKAHESTEGKSNEELAKLHEELFKEFLKLEQKGDQRTVVENQRHAELMTKTRQIKDLLDKGGHKS
ncbi:MAG TPA: hypothetical protein VG965_07295 [Patescibacteria group bacterium]|nr:hypothetical protein [Patescibacteria group bacterium]